MNTLKKLSASALLSVLALTSIASARASEAFEVTLPALTVATNEVGKLIAAEMATQFRNAMKAPRPVRVRKSPTVTVSEAIEPVVESVTVVATRLPIETVIVVATRLPIETVIVAATRLPMETIVVAATRLPQRVDPTELMKTVRTAQVRL